MDIIAVNNFGDTRDGGLAGPMGLFLVVLMCIATVLLIRNMNKRIRRLPDSFDDEAERERVAEIARLNADLERSGGDVAEGVEADRSAKTAGAAEDEVAAVPEEKHESASDSRRATP
ncbi:hypothetical protein [Actinoplanes siamensis]|uniref:Uncharacterized protein n=1 Tax=Actinoplanes siamensis TaxID=1223317 RepID=A0A919TLM1_9ACTN|nr:hypothetical protein [Actinoplanes siamensis]GIF06549.1 hypothetical protein Asi03nite_40870 [Actinoplanes siamensis]